MKINIQPHPTRPGWYYLVYRPNGSKGKKTYVPVEGYDNSVVERDRLYASYDNPNDKVTHPRIKEIYEEYLAWVKREQSEATYKGKNKAFRGQIIPFWGEYRVKQLTQKHFDAWCEHLEGKKGAITNYTYNLKALITWMVKRNYAEKLTFSPEITTYKPARKIVPHPIDIDSIIAAIPDERKRVLLNLMLLSGMRWNEASRLEWRNVDTKTGVIRMEESETAEDEIVPIPDELLPWFEKNRGFGWVFPNPKTKEPYKNRFLHSIHNAANRLGLKGWGSHMLRHASATYLYESTEDIYAVQQHLRHKNIAATQIYTHFSTAKRAKGQKALVAQLDKLRGRVKESECGELANNKYGLPASKNK